MRSGVFKGLLCALLCVILSTGQVYAVSFEGLEGATPTFGEGGITEGDSTDTEPLQANPFDDAPIEEVVYTPVSLSDSTKDFFATLDGDVTLTLISSERDFVDGTYVEYYNNFYTDDKNYYYTFINTLKSISELNEYVKLEFVDPFSTSSYAFLDDYSKYDLRYGDLFVTCYSNFDGSPTTRRSVVDLNKLFKTKKDSEGVPKIQGINIEKVLVRKLESLRHYRNINVAYISDLCMEENIQHLKTYLKGKRYNFDSVTLKDEKLNGYDMIFIAAPIRDVTLEEIVLLNTFLDNNGDYGKTVMYFCAERYVRLPNLHSFLKKWGVNINETQKLVCADEAGFFAKNTQLIAASTGSDYTADSDTTGGAYIMNNCTPIEVISGETGVNVKTILKTASGQVNSISKSKRNKDSATGFGLVYSDYPLLTLSQKSAEEKTPSSVVVSASSNFITSYLALQNPKSDKDYKGGLNGNLQLTAELLEKLNSHHRSEESGLGKYAVGLADLGYDTTSGLRTEYILQVAIVSVAVFIILLVGLLVLSAEKCRKIKPEEI